LLSLRGGDRLVMRLSVVPITSAALYALALLAAPLEAQAPAAREFRVIRLDPGLDTIVAPDARLETLGEHFGLTEGPVWAPDPAGGYLVFSDLTVNVIYKRTPDGRLSHAARRQHRLSRRLSERDRALARRAALHHRLQAALPRTPEIAGRAAGAHAL